MIKAYKYRIYPNKGQRKKIDETIGSCRWVYNNAWYKNNKNQEEYEKETILRLCYGEIDGLTRKEYNKGRPKLPTYAGIVKANRKIYPWLEEVESQALNQTMQDFNTSFKNFYGRIKKGKVGKEAGFPKCKKKKNEKQSYRTYESSHTRRYADFQDHTIELPKIGKVKAILHRHFTGKVCYITVSREQESYYVSITVDNGKQNKEYRPIGEIDKSNSIGIDLGLKTGAVLSNGVEIDNPKYLRKQEKKKGKLQRILSRRKGNIKGEIKSNRWKRLNKRINKIQTHIAKERENFWQEESSKIINYCSDNQVAMIVLEDLNVKGMLANHKLSKSISDVSWTRFTNMLKYKAEWAGIRITEINRFAPSSQICSNCEYQNKEVKDLKIRNWICPKCGAEHDRDLNAAINIRNIALKQLNIESEKKKQIPRFTGKLTDVESSIKRTRRSVKGNQIPELTSENEVVESPLNTQS